MFRARGAPESELRWHYRSRHESLIAVSNHEFYDDRLVVFPSPLERSASLGLVFHHMPNTVYGRGGSRFNREEARAVARAVMDHASHSPQDSLGVAAFSLAQAQAILDELEVLRRGQPECEHFFADHEFEPFFVKNLENVQGETRDVVLISIGYGRDADGFVSMNFGPLNSRGGWRRLNVLISRSRRRCEVFTNITSADIRVGESGSASDDAGRGLSALRSFLQYAESGVLGAAEPTGEEPESEFEWAVLRALQARGYTVHCQVGVSGFRIDLAVVDAGASGTLPARDRVRRSHVPQLPLGSRSRSAAAEGAGGQEMDHPPRVEHGVVQEPGPGDGAAGLRNRGRQARRRHRRDRGERLGHRGRARRPGRSRVSRCGWRAPPTCSSWVMPFQRRPSSTKSRFLGARARHLRT